MHGRQIRLISRWLLIWSETAGSEWLILDLDVLKALNRCRPRSEVQLTHLDTSFRFRSELTASTRGHLNDHPQQDLTDHFQISSKEQTGRVSLLAKELP